MRGIVSSQMYPPEPVDRECLHPLEKRWSAGEGEGTDHECPHRLWLACAAMHPLPLLAYTLALTCAVIRPLTSSAAVNPLTSCAAVNPPTSCVYARFLAGLVCPCTCSLARLPGLYYTRGVACLHALSRSSRSSVSHFSSLACLVCLALISLALLLALSRSSRSSVRAPFSLVDLLDRHALARLCAARAVPLVRCAHTR